MSRSLNDEAWDDLLRELDIPHEIESKGYFDIGAYEIKRFTNREPRLMCKHDHKEKVPKPLKFCRLSVLAVENGKYRIAPTEPFMDLKSAVSPIGLSTKPFQIPPHLQTLNSQNITSESKALDIAYVSGMIDHITSEGSALTIRGRNRSREFAFELPSTVKGKESVEYSVSGVQLEVDAGYEGEHEITLIEAKMGNFNNINIRQLLYPQIHFEREYAKKRVSTYLMCYDSPGLFHFIPFKYDETGPRVCLDLWQTLKLQSDVSRNFWQELQDTRIDIELTGYSAPFPQADRFDVIIATLNTLHHLGSGTKEQIFVDRDIVPRQYDYYINSLVWLGVVERKPGRDGTYFLSDLGSELMNLCEIERMFSLAKIFFANDSANEFLNQEKPHIRRAERKRNELLTDSTFERRMQTVVSWCKFFRKKL